MGYSASAELFYGYVFEEEGAEQDLELDLGEELQQEYEADPREFIPDYIFSKLTGFELLPWEQQPDDYWEKKRAAEQKYREETGRELLGFTDAGSYMGEYGQFALTAHHAGSGYGANRVTLPVDIDTKKLDAQLDEALQILGIEKPAEGYGWYLAASYG